MVEEVLSATIDLSFLRAIRRIDLGPTLVGPCGLLKKELYDWTPLSLCPFALLLAATTFAQTKVSGTAQCTKSDPQYVIEVGDRPGHIMLLAKSICTWTKAMDIEGEKTKESDVIVSVDATSSRTVSNGMSLSTTESGDKTFAAIRDTGTRKDGKTQEAHGTWSYTGGTGKLQGIKGKGTYKTTFHPDGSYDVEAEGEYVLAPAKNSKAKQ